MQEAENQNSQPTASTASRSSLSGCLHRAPAVLLMLLACILHGSLALAADPTGLAGRGVGALLDSLRTQGLTFIYNNELIPAQLTVRAEPRARAGLALAIEVLQAHGLSAVEVVPGVYTVIAASRPSPDRASPGTFPPPTGAPLEEIVVNTSRYTLAQSSISYSFLTQDDLQSMPRLADEPLRAVSRLPGVTNNGFSALGQIRGGAVNETGIVLDGLRLYEPFHLKNFLSPVSLLDSRLIDTIEVYAGGFPAIYGGSMSGIIEANSVRPERPRYYEAGLSLFHASGLAAADFAGGQGRVLASLRRSNAGLLAKASENDFGTPNYSDGFAKLEYDLDAATRASLRVLISNDRITALRDSATQRAKAEYRNAYTWGMLERDWSARASSRAIVSLTEVTNQRRGTIDNPARRSGSVFDEREFHIAGVQLDNQWRPGKLEHRFGAAFHYLTGHYDYSSSNSFAAGFPFPDSPALQVLRSSSLDPSGSELAGYWDVRANVARGLTLEAGVRVDHQTYDDVGAEQWSPRLSMLYDLSSTTRVRASWGSYAQAQGINELQVEDGIERFNRPQRAQHLIASIEHELAAGLLLRVEGYRKDYRRISPRFENLFDALVLLPELESDRVRLDPSSARSEGIEVLLELAPIGGWSGRLSYARSRVTDRIGGRNERRSWDQRDAVSAAVAWSRGPWSANAGFTYHTGWPTTSLALGGSAASAQQVLTGPRNGERLGDFSTLDVRLTRTFALSRGVLDVFVEASNALMQRNPCCVEYDVRRNADGATSITRSTDDWLPLVPSAGVLWRY